MAERAHGAQLTTDWKKYSMAAAAGVAGLMVIEGFIHLSHDHHSVSALPSEQDHVLTCSLPGPTNTLPIPQNPKQGLSMGQWPGESVRR